jgi:hypothetical protein
MRQAGEVDWGGEEVGCCDEGGPAAEEEEEVYCVGETPPVGEGADYYRGRKRLMLVYTKEVFIEDGVLDSSIEYIGKWLLTIGGQSDHDQAEENLYKAYSVDPRHRHFE